MTSAMPLPPPVGDILGRIGATAMVPLRRIAPAGGARVLLKLESENPTGSMKDRMALAMVEAAEADGRLAPGAPVVEYTGGSTGVSLALVCAVKGHPLHVVSSDAFAPAKLEHMRVLGARLRIVASDGGRMTGQLTRDMIALAGEISASLPGSFWTDQMNNLDQLAAYHRMAGEIRQQTGGRIDALVQSVGTAASIRGLGEGVHCWAPHAQVVAVEPAESAVLSGGASGAHRIDGIGAGYVVPMWRAELASRIDRVSTDDARAMAARLAAEEGLHAGTSTGANVVAALRVAADLGAGATVVTIMCDSGLKYLHG